MVEQIAKFNFNSYTVTKSLFEVGDPEKISNDLSIGIELSGNDMRSEKKFYLTMTLVVTDSAKQLNVEVTAVGRFLFEEGCEEMELGNFFNLNAPAILFPYLRAHIATLSTLSGLRRPLLLPTLNLSDLAQKLSENTTKS